jgi:methionine-rich copper-binding protein CopC
MMKHVVVAVLAAAIAMSAGRAALAHAFLDNATPKVGAVLRAAPKAIRMQFTQPIEPAFSHICLFTRDGKPVNTGPVATEPSDQTQVIAPIVGTLPPGRYEVRWDVLSVDTHRTNGHFPFTYQP